MMSLAKSVPEGLKPQECDSTKLCEPSPVPYEPDKDEVQEFTKLRNLQIKISLEKDMTLNVFSLAQERDPRSFSHACDGSTGCNQEA
jgi:hypothetical protein